MENKHCPKCETSKPISDFQIFIKKGKPTHYAYCTPCKRLAYREWHKNNIEKRLKINKDWMNKNKDKVAVTQSKCYESRKVRCPSDIIWHNMGVRTRNPRPREAKYYADKLVLITKEEFKTLWDSVSECGMCGKSFKEVSRSVDRIVTTKHYEVGNLQFICMKCHGKKTKDDYRP